VLLATDRGEPAPAAGTHPLQGIAHRPAPPIDRPPAPAPAPEVTTTTTPAPETPVADQLGEALGRAELLHLPDGDHRLQVDLHPAELGAVGVDVTVHHDRVHVVLRPEHPAAAELLGQSLADLRRQLHEAGIGLADLRLGERRAALADQRAGHGDADRPGRRRGDAVSAGATAAHASPVALARHRLPTSSTTAVDLML
jgi:flagellar hook-length control protein FliK